MIDLPDRFWSKVNMQQGCWHWTGAINGDGYGNFWWEGKTQRAHKVIFVAVYGEFSDDLQIDHRCHTLALIEGSCAGGRCSHRRCVNPEHLALVTGRENTLSGGGVSALNARKTHCINGHPFVSGNIRIRNLNERECMICATETSRRNKRRAKEKANV